MKDKDVIEGSKINWHKESHWSTNKWYTTMYVDKKFGIAKQVDVHRDSFGFPTNKTRETFFIDGDNSEYKSLDKMIEVYNQTKQQQQ